MEEPAALAEDILHAVPVLDPGHRLSRHRPRRLVPNARHVGADRLDREIHVAAAVGEAAELGGELVERPGERAAARRQALDEQERRQDAVPLRQVERERVAAALLAAGDGLAAVHQLGDVLEADSRLAQRGAEGGRDAVDLEGRREGLRDAARDAAAAEDVEEQEGEDLVGRHEVPGGVEHAQAVRVAVLGDGEVEAFLRDPPGGVRQVRRDRLRVDPSEERVSRRAEADGAQRAGPREQLRQERSGGAVHRVRRGPRGRRRGSRGGPRATRGGRGSGVARSATSIVPGRAARGAGRSASADTAA